jgi:RNA polymerase sigma-70 factor (ECF subfamily)
MCGRMSGESDRGSAFERLFTENYWPVRRYLLRRIGQPSADDVLAETFLVAWRRFDSVSDDPLPWLLGVARRVLANHLRAERRRSSLLTRLRTTSTPEAYVAPASASLDSEVAAALSALSAREREALLLVAWEGLDPLRAARVAGCSAPAFRVRLHRARRKVEAQLGRATASGQSPEPFGGTP